MSPRPVHVPVLLQEVLRTLQPAPGDRVLDCTLGLGGHAKEFLKAIGKTGVFLGLDADEQNLSFAKENLAPWASQTSFRQINFRDAATVGEQFDVVLADLGLSSPHLDDAERGFSFRFSAPLDLRFDRSVGKTGAHMLKTIKEEDLTRIFWKYGEIQRARQLAHALQETFQAEGAAGTTNEVRECVERIFGYKAASVLPQVFQALRIAVNDEMGALESLLASVPELLKAGGRLGIISYHSLEDRMVKRAFKAIAMPQIDPRTGAIVSLAPFEILTRKAVVPSAEELAQNPRSRSAKFRAIRRVR